MNSYKRTWVCDSCRKLFLWKTFIGRTNPNGNHVCIPCALQAIQQRGMGFCSSSYKPSNSFFSIPENPNPTNTSSFRINSYKKTWVCDSCRKLFLWKTFIGQTNEIGNHVCIPCALQAIQQRGTAFGSSSYKQNNLFFCVPENLTPTHAASLYQPNNSFFCIPERLTPTHTASSSKPNNSSFSVPENLNPTNTSILKEIECPICMEYMTSPIFQCTNGHTICQTCKMKLSKCPTCRIALGDIRNRVLERITEDLLYPCRNDGCSRGYKYSELREHESKCEFVLS